nr:unnamed protein product [Digitaria exilis]CAB3484151.1 unnamed protein product [Digitaria exilis]
MSLSTLRMDRPPGLAAVTALSLISATRWRISPPLSPSMASRMSASTSTRLTSSPISIPMPHSVHLYRQLVCCSAKNGQHTMGTPPHMLSNVEFQPECVRNTPTASCSSTAACGHHVDSMLRPSTDDKNSGGNPGESPPSPLTRSGRTCSADITVMLPKLTYTTERGGRPSSHRSGASCSFHRLDPMAATGLSTGTLFRTVSGSGPTV